MELTVKGICKSFGAGNILDGVDFSIRGGEICALLGENGAGKSTLMNIIGGVYQADSGDIFIDGKKTVFASPSESMHSGIAFIHQELNLINHLTVYENMFLFGFRKKGIVLDRNYMISETRKAFEKIGIDIDPCTPVETLDASYKQTLEITRALMSEASVIIMDEPTASLTSAEIERMFGIMRTLKEKGIAMIFISHKLNEVMEICDRYTVLRNGILIKSGNVAEVTTMELASYMVGHEVIIGSAPVSEYGEEMLTIENLSDNKNFFNMSLSVKRGEVLGITGLLGDGRSQLFGSVFGIYGGSYSGKVILDGKQIHPVTPHEAVSHGIAYLPKNRKENAIIADMSIIDNGTIVTLRNFCKGLLLDKKAQKKVFDEQAHNLHIKMSDGEKLITALSGGNQQKAVLAKWLISDPKVLILDNPTQGVDVGAKEEIYSIIGELAKSGIAIVVLSSEAQEIIRLCKRTIVMYHGRNVGEVTGDGMTEQNLMYLATGAGKETDKDEQ